MREEWKARWMRQAEARVTSPEIMEGIWKIAEKLFDPDWEEVYFRSCQIWSGQDLPWTYLRIVREIFKYVPDPVEEGQVLYWGVKIARSVESEKRGKLVWRHVP